MDDDSDPRAEYQEIFAELRKRKQEAAEFDRELFAVAPWWDDSETAWWRLAGMLSRRYGMSAERIVTMNADQLQGLFRDVLSSPSPSVPARYAKLALWAENNLVGQQSKYLSILMQSDGKKPLNDLATEMGWYEEQRDSQQSSYQRDINKKMRPKGLPVRQPFRISRKKNVIHLEKN